MTEADTQQGPIIIPPEKWAMLRSLCNKHYMMHYHGVKVPKIEQPKPPIL